WDSAAIVQRCGKPVAACVVIDNAISKGAVVNTAARESGITDDRAIDQRRSKGAAAICRCKIISDNAVAQRAGIDAASQRHEAGIVSFRKDGIADDQAI